MVSPSPFALPPPSPLSPPRPSPARRAPAARRRRLGPVALAALAAALGACARGAPAPAPAAAATAVPPPEVAPAAGTVVAPLAAPVPVVGNADVASLVERLKPTVVNITTTSTRGGPDGDEAGLPFGFPFGLPPGGAGPRQARALGTGFIVDPAGFVVTNAHVVQGADEIKVRLSDERTLPAKVVGRDAALDLAVLQVEGATNLSAVSLGDSDGLRVGDWVLAIGNPFGLGHTVTLGITSAKGRSMGGLYDDFIQTDASINPGNSGGPLFNLKGEVVGIPTAIRQGAQGIGFAVPVNSLRDVLPQLRERGAVSRGYLGVRYQPVTDELAQGLGVAGKRGALVSDVEANTPGAKAGLQPGDVITSVNGSEVARFEDLARLIAKNAPGSKVKLGVVRSGKPLELSTTLDTRPDRDGDRDEGGGNGAPGPAAPPKGRLGIVLDDAPGGGAVVRGIAPRSPAFGQLRAGDVILEVDKKPVRNAADLARRVEALPSGKVLVLRVRQGRLTNYVAIKLT
ncbi:MAG TPA: Do family serine endopeptidase [Polyangiaceae bacterium]|nr:Do family serine endopeptidase [Polyangiaceae bacterium]